MGGEPFGNGSVFPVLGGAGAMEPRRQREARLSEARHRWQAMAPKGRALAPHVSSHLGIQEVLTLAFCFACCLLPWFVLSVRPSTYPFLGIGIGIGSDQNEVTHA